MSGETVFIALDGVAIIGLVVLVIAPLCWIAWRTLRGGRK